MKPRAKSQELRARNNIEIFMLWTNHYPLITNAGAANV